MKNYVFKKQGIIVKAKSERQAREIYNQYLHDSSDLAVAEFLKSKGIKFSKIDGTNDNVIIEFDNEKDWTLGSKELQTKFGRKGYESRKEGNSYKVILGDELIDDISHLDIAKQIELSISAIERLVSDLKSKKLSSGSDVERRILGITRPLNSIKLPNKFEDSFNEDAGVDRYDEFIDIGGQNNFTVTSRMDRDGNIIIGASRWSKSYKSIREIESDIKSLQEVKKKIQALEAKYDTSF